MALAQRGLAGGGTIQTASHLGSPGVDARNGHGSAYLHGRHPRDRARCAGQRGPRGAGDVHHRRAAQQEPPLLLVWNEQCRQRLQPVRAAIPRALREPAAGIDQDEQQGTQADAATTWVGPRSAVVALETAQSFSFDDVANSDVVIWDLHEQTNATAAPSSPH